jgi:hypothetical protein
VILTAELVDRHRGELQAMPAWLFSRLVSRELVLMWHWLARDVFDADVEATTQIHASICDMTTWLREKREPK